MKEWGSGLFYLVLTLALVWWVTAPADDQVCRMGKNWLVETLHGTGWQPTCQHLIDQIEDRTRQAEAKASELEDRLAEVENRLKM